VTGKGGVGKSTIAAAIASREAEIGRKTLLVELGEESFYKPFFDLPVISYEPQKISPNLYVAIWDVEHCLREYVLHFLKVERLYKIFFENRVMRTFINAAPAVSEIAILGKVTSNYRHHGPPLPYDVVIVDAYATGHFLALLKAPKGLSEALKSGPFGDQSRAIMKTLLNPEVTGYVIVTLAEGLPTTETEELWKNLKSDFGIEAQIVCNRLLKTPLQDETLKKMLSDSSIKSTRPFLKYLNYVLERQREYFERVKKIKTKVTPIYQSLKHIKGLSLAREISQDL